MVSSSQINFTSDTETYPFPIGEDSDYVPPQPEELTFDNDGTYSV